MRKLVMFMVHSIFMISVSLTSLSAYSSKTGRGVYVDSFDFQTAQYFYAVRNVSDDENEVLNICLFDIKNNTTKYVFPLNRINSSDNINKDEIVGFYYQIGYKSDENRMLLFPRDAISQYRALPLSVDSQKASRNMIIVTYSKSSKRKTIWLCGKNGDGLKKLAEYDDNTRFEIDSMFNKILLIRQEGNVMKIDTFNY